jgi:hypothetical protein
MFELDIEKRFEAWKAFRESLTLSMQPLKDTQFFWNSAPFIPYNYKIDRFNKNSWPTPWEIIISNRYDDFTKAIMIAYTLKLSKKFCDSSIVIKTLAESTGGEYNVVVVSETWVLNYFETEPVLLGNIIGSFMVENQIKLEYPR